MTNFFWFCSGANISLLKRCPTESSKYVGIGATVLFTGMLASISAGYALFTVFDSIWSSVAFGLFWGAMIFNLDRYIVSSMKKRDDFWKEFKIAIPRLLLAILLALVISKPLELKIFEKEINQSIDKKKIKLKEVNIENINKLYAPRIQYLEDKILEYKNEEKAKEAYRNLKQLEYDNERFGNKTTGTTGVPGLGVNAELKEKQLSAAQNDLELTKSRNLPKIAEIGIEIKKLQDQLNNDIKSGDPNIRKYDGLAARIDALSELTKESQAMYWSNLFIILLFIAIETSPIFVKLISTKGPYDDLLEKHEHSIENYKIEQMSKLNQKTNERLEIVIESGNNAIREELEGNKNLMRRIIEAETELAQEMINQWKESEIEKIKLNKEKKL